MPPDEKLEHLRRVPLFAKMGTSELERLGQLADEVEVGLDTVLAEQGTIGHEFFFVLDGRVMVLDGRTPVRTLGPGDFFGEIALLEQRAAHRDGPRRGHRPAARHRPSRVPRADGRVPDRSARRSSTRSPNACVATKESEPRA